MGRIIFPTGIDGSRSFFQGSSESEGTGSIFHRQGGEIFEFSRRLRLSCPVQQMSPPTVGSRVPNTAEQRAGRRGTKQGFSQRKLHRIDGNGIRTLEILASVLERGNDLAAVFENCQITARHPRTAKMDEYVSTVLSGHGCSFPLRTDS